VHYFQDLTTAFECICSILTLCLQCDRTCEASLTLYCKRKDIKADKVEQLQARLEETMRRKADLEHEIAEHLRKNEHLKAQFSAKIKAEIAEAQAAMADLSRPTMTVEEASVRLKQLQSRVSSDDVAQPLFG